MKERMLYVMVNEGAKILEERKAMRASDIDIIWQNGYNWPAYQGGPMWWADLVGPKAIVAKLNEFADQLGDQYRPAPLLVKLAEEGKRFQDMPAQDLDTKARTPANA
jgi:3-hydroxyacyl-CoA dehydrogenase